jgi:hypothetical protein
VSIARMEGEGAGYPAAETEIRDDLPNELTISNPTALATAGGKAFPTCRYAAVLPPTNSQSSGKPCRRATIRTVRRGMPTKFLSGASPAMPWPSTPSVSQAFFARVGPRSGPPYLRLPPTMVGAISLALSRHSLAPFHPWAEIRSNNTSPTVGGSLKLGPGQVNCSAGSSPKRQTQRAAAVEVRRTRMP